MRTIQSLAVVALCGLLSSCATLVAANPDALLGEAHRSEARCFDRPRAEIEERVRSYMRSCHRPYNASVATMVPTGSSTIAVSQVVRANWQVEERESTAGDRQFLVRFDQGYTLAAAVQTTASCQASVQVFAANFGWKNRFERVLAAANGETPGCLSQ